MKIKNIFTKFFGKKLKKLPVNIKETYELVVHNDNVNSFDNVINSLIDICEHDTIQAEQCAMLIDRVGKIDVRHGDLYDMMVLQDKLKKRGLNVSIDTAIIEE
ncbi:ATP-dependent Clp protease adaptor ClpS [bacterium]|jgi:ATP-dependent Clp protease adaptor protein ClpS|nr:ATP-dependent Clp protease adaptor ClpS [bacterium]